MVVAVWSGRGDIEQLFPTLPKEANFVTEGIMKKVYSFLFVLALFVLATAAYAVTPIRGR